MHYTLFFIHPQTFSTLNKKVTKLVGVCLEEKGDWAGNKTEICEDAF